MAELISLHAGAEVPSLVTILYEPLEHEQPFSLHMVNDTKIRFRGLFFWNLTAPARSDRGAKASYVRGISTGVRGVERMG